MSDNEQQYHPSLQMNAQYIKDLSFEVPGAPMIFAEFQNNEPQLTLAVNVQSAPIAENVFEVVLKMHIEAKVEEKVAFILELAHGGVFTVHVPEEHLNPILLIEVPNRLFPFVSVIIANAIRDGGFTPVMLPPIDFRHLYQQRLEQASQQKLEQTPETNTPVN